VGRKWPRQLGQVRGKLNNPLILVIEKQAKNWTWILDIFSRFFAVCFASGSCLLSLLRRKGLGKTLYPAARAVSQKNFVPTDGGQ
jgi:hypothetical protein